MAGIGFRLRALSEQDNLLAPVASIGHAAGIAAGPWLFTVAALGAISVLSADDLTASALDGFRLVVIYAFAISLVATAPIVLVATRMLGDAVYARRFEHVRALLLATAVLSALAAGAVGLLCHAVVLGLPAPTVMAATSCCAIVAVIWVALAFCGAVRDYRGITRGFLAGLALAVPGTLLAAALSGQAEAMVWAFNAGLMVVLASLAGRVLVTFPRPATDLPEAIAWLAAGLRRYAVLALAGLLGALGLWIDKWVMWLGPIGVRHDTGLVHAPLYDSAMFTACLTIIPALALFVTHVETTFFERYRAYHAAIRSHATLAHIEARAEALRATTLATLGRIGLIQAALCTIVVLGAPSIVEATGMLFQQVGIFRLGALGALFQFVFFAATSLLLYFDRHGRFLLLQALFVLLQAAFALVSIELGPSFHGLGYLAACILAAALALAVLERTMDELTYITFILSIRRPAPPDPSRQRLPRGLFPRIVFWRTE